MKRDLIIFLFLVLFLASFVSATSHISSVSYCGDGTCDDQACLGTSCPEPETAQNCPADCGSGDTNGDTNGGTQQSKSPPGNPPIPPETCGGYDNCDQSNMSTCNTCCGTDTVDPLAPITGNAVSPPNSGCEDTRCEVVACNCIKAGTKVTNVGGLIVVCSPDSNRPCVCSNTGKCGFVDENQCSKSGLGGPGGPSPPDIPPRAPPIDPDTCNGGYNTCDQSNMSTCNRCCNVDSDCNLDTCNCITAGTKVTNHGGLIVICSPEAKAGCQCINNRCVPKKGNQGFRSIRLSNGRNAEVKILPETASQKAVEVLGNLNFTIELKEVPVLGTNKKLLVYELKAEKKGKLFGFIPIIGNVLTRINAENGKVEGIEKSWWAFLATGI